MYKRWTNEDIKNEIDKVAKHFNFKVDLPIEISKRAKKRLGAFYFKVENKRIKPIKFVFAESLVNGLYSEEVVKEVIAHEYVHYYCDVRSNKINKHNTYFKHICREYGISDRATLAITTDLNAKKSEEYKLYCRNCNKVVAVYKREATIYKKLDNYVSKCCNSKLYYK